jgi:hypothetical protein
VARLSCADVLAVSKEQIEVHPKGYPRLAAFLDQSDEVHLFRRFGYLTARLLIRLQTELTELEAQLEKLDQEDLAPENPQQFDPFRDSKTWVDQSYHDFRAKKAERKAEGPQIIELDKDGNMPRFVSTERVGESLYDICENARRQYKKRKLMMMVEHKIEEYGIIKQNLLNIKD